MKLFEAAIVFVEFVLKQIVVPVATFLHEWGIIEVLLYLASSQIITEASWMDVTKQTSKQMASIVCFTGLIIFYVSFMYSTVLHGSKFM